MLATDRIDDALNFVCPSLMLERLVHDTNKYVAMLPSEKNFRQQRSIASNRTAGRSRRSRAKSRTVNLKVTSTCGVSCY